MRLFPDILDEDNCFSDVCKMGFTFDYSLIRCVLGLSCHDDMCRQLFCKLDKCLFNYFFKLVGSQPGNCNNINL